MYADDLEIFTWLRADAPAGVRCIEAEVMDLADDISYSVHDVEDAVVRGKLDFASRRRRAQQVIDAVLDWYGTAVGPDELDAAGPAVEAHLWQTDSRARA